MKKIDRLEEYTKMKSFKESLDIPLDKDVKIKLLAQGEYNINYIFNHPITNKKLILRVNTGSQMHLDNQIEYEYNALDEIYESKRVPKVYYVDKSLKNLDYGVLVMEFLEGRALIYETDLSIAAKCLSDIHGLRVKEDSSLISPNNLLLEMLKECRSMSEVYLSSDLANEEVKKTIERLIDFSEKKIRNEKETYLKRHYINTELNSGNFLINGEEKDNYIIDWEKPILGDPVQDIAHLLAPTTTFWKTDTILKRDEMINFIKEYIGFVKGRFNTEGIINRFNTYLTLTCLRGITWCSMAWVQYQNKDKVIKNDFTYEKIKAYLKPEFLNYVEKEYFV